jgi:hypothetical protein
VFRPPRDSDPILSRQLQLRMFFRDVAVATDCAPFPTPATTALNTHRDATILDHRNCAWPFASADRR